MSLVLGRKIGQTVHIGDDVTVTVVSVSRGEVRLAFDAPQEVIILREELVDTYYDEGMEG